MFFSLTHSIDFSHYGTPILSTLMLSWVLFVKVKLIEGKFHDANKWEQEHEVLDFVSVHFTGITGSISPYK